MSEFRGKIVVGVAVSILVAIGLAVGAVLISPQSLEINHDSFSGISSLSSQTTISSTTNPISSLSSTTSTNSGVMQTTQSNSTTVQPSSCATLFSGGLALTGAVVDNTNYSSLRLFTMQPSSVAVLCVTYLIAPGTFQGYTGSPQVYNLTGSADMIKANCVGGGCVLSSTKSSEISVTASPSSVIISDSSQSQIEVTYTITTSANSSGYYSLSFFNECPPYIPFAVQGVSQAPLTGSDYKGFFTLLNCSQQGVLEDGLVTGIAGMQMGWVYDQMNSSLP